MLLRRNDMNRREFTKALPVLAAAAIVVPTEILRSGAVAIAPAPVAAGGGRTIYWLAQWGDHTFHGEMKVGKETYCKLIHHSEDLCTWDVHDMLTEAMEKSESMRSDPSAPLVSIGVSCDPYET